MEELSFANTNSVTLRCLVSQFLLWISNCSEELEKSGDRDTRQRHTDYSCVTCCLLERSAHEAFSLVAAVSAHLHAGLHSHCPGNTLLLVSVNKNLEVGSSLSSPATVENAVELLPPAGAS